MERLKWIFRAWRYRLKLERQEIQIVLDHLGKGQTAIDVGAHKGGYTYWMRSRVGSSGHIVAFEPQPVLARRLQALMDRSGFANVIVENQGVSSTPGILTLKVPGQGTSPGASFVQTNATDPAAQNIPIPVITLDAYTEAQGLNSISMIKCDAEGHELEVFRGAERILQEQRPLLLFECETRHRPDSSVQDVFDYLLGFGYQGWALTRSERINLEDFSIERFQASPDQPDYINNFLFIHPQTTGGTES